MLKKTSSEVCQIEGQHQPSALVAATIDTFLLLIRVRMVYVQMSWSCYETYPAPAVRYSILDIPPWHESVLLGFQHYLTMLGSTVLIPFLIVPVRPWANIMSAYPWKDPKSFQA